LFIIFLWIRFKKPLPTISDSWYYLKYPTNLLFPIFTISIGILMPLHIVDNPIFFFLSGAGLIFTGVAAMFKVDIITRMIHNIGAITCGVGALVGLWIDFGLWIPMVVFLLSYGIIIILRNIGIIKKYVWWIEISAFLSTFIGLMCIYL